RMLRGHADQVIHWPIDELGTLHVTYIEKVFKACDRNNIIIVGAFPNSDLNILKLFTNRYMMNPKTKVLSAMRPQQGLLAQRISELTSSQNNLETVDE
ncbi:MAG: ATP-binding protein, partial [Methylococcaceae bacterium]|nr:ATP-binding protein [Methylococcaceae bacterium]